MCNAPIQINQNQVAVRAPCGHCMACARRRTMSWTLRLLLEMTEHEHTDFLTLTYKPDTCPEKLEEEHFTRFIRALRRSTPTRVRYFCCGEYGGKTGRPHWHVLLFGHRLPVRGLSAIEQWPHGHVYTGEIERASAQYVCRYTLKSAMKDDKPQVIRMSRRPGLGLTTLRSIATQMATKIPDMDYYPPVMTYQRRTWWLDRRAYASCVDAYLNAGGVLSFDVAPCNDLLDDQQPRALPIDAIVRDWVRKTDHGKT